MTTHIDKVREALEYMRDNEDSTPYWSRLADAGWSALQAHEEEDLEREVVLAELVGTLVGIRVCAIIDGRPDWRAVAEQIDAALAKVKP